MTKIQKDIIEMYLEHYYNKFWEDEEGTEEEAMDKAACLVLNEVLKFLEFGELPKILDFGTPWKE